MIENEGRSVRVCDLGAPERLPRFSFEPVTTQSRLRLFGTAELPGPLSLSKVTAQSTLSLVSHSSSLSIAIHPPTTTDTISLDQRNTSLH